MKTVLLPITYVQLKVRQFFLYIVFIFHSDQFNPNKYLTIYFKNIFLEVEQFPLKVLMRKYPCLQLAKPSKHGIARYIKGCLLLLIKTYQKKFELTFYRAYKSRKNNAASEGSASTVLCFLD